MKIMLLLLLVPTCLFGQKWAGKYPIDSTTNQITYKEIVQAPGSKAQLYARAKEWAAKTYVSSKDVIELDDPTNGKLIGKGIIVVETLSITDNGVETLKHNVEYTLTLTIRDNKYRYVITDFNVNYFNKGDKIPLEALLKSFEGKTLKLTDTLPFRSTPKANIDQLIASLKKAMSVKDDF